MPDPVEEIRRRIAAAGDPERAPAMRAYMKSELPFRGVASAPLRALVRDEVRRNPLPDRASWEAAVRRLWDEAGCREEWYAALTVARHPAYRAHQDVDALPLYRHLVVTGAWWDVVDEVASHLVGGVLTRDPAGATPVLRSWAVADDPWLRRAAILCQLRRGEDTDPDLLRLALVENLEPSPYGRTFWIRKAVGWALRQHARSDPAWVRAFVAEHGRELSGLSRREALKHLGDP